MSDDYEEQNLLLGAGGGGGGGGDNNINDDDENLLLGNNNNDDNNNNENEGDSSSDDDDSDDDDNNDDGAEKQKDVAENQQQDDDGQQEQQQYDENNDDIPLVSMSKKEAKKKLSKKEYKKWKKAQKKSKKKDKKKSKKDVGGSGKAGKKKEKEASSKSSKKKKNEDETNGMYFAGAETEDAAAFGSAAPPVRRGTGANKAKAQSSSVKKPQISEEELKREANAVVMAMTDARRQDEAARKAGQPPLHRLAIKDLVANAARKVALHEHLVNAGILDELTGWLADAKSNDLAPVDLRLVALYILDNLAFEGINGGMRISSRNKFKRDPNTGEMYLEEDLGYAGVTAEMLQATKLGWAVNFIRRHPNASAENRSTATRLLEKFSRVFRGDDEGGARKNAGANGKQLWSSQSDNTILPPFEVMPSITQRFIEASTKADPNDPISYLRVRRAYNPPSFITGLGGEAAAKAMAGARDAATAHQLANNRGAGRKTNSSRNVELPDKDGKKKKKKNTKASLESDDDGSLGGSGDDDDDGDLDDWLA